MEEQNLCDSTWCPIVESITHDVCKEPFFPCKQLFFELFTIRNYISYFVLYARDICEIILFIITYSIPNIVLRYLEILSSSIYYLKARVIHTRALEEHTCTKGYIRIFLISYSGLMQLISRILYTWRFLRMKKTRIRSHLIAEKIFSLQKRLYTKNEYCLQN